MIKVKELSSKHRKTLADVLTTPPKSGIKWDDVVSLINKLGGEDQERQRITPEVYPHGLSLSDSSTSSW